MGEMTFKQAEAEMRQVIKALRPFEKIEAVLKAATNAEASRTHLEELIEALSISEKRWSAAVEEARGQYRTEKAKAEQAVVTRTAQVDHDLAAKQRDHGAEKAKAEAAIAEVISAGKQANAELSERHQALTTQVAEMEARLRRGNEEYEAFRQKVGVS